MNAMLSICREREGIKRWFKMNARTAKYSDIEYQRARLHYLEKQLKDATRAAASAVPHGTTAGYSKHSCRCTECCSANTAYIREYRQRKGMEPLVDAPAHHINALMASGIRQLDIAKQVGVSNITISRMRHGYSRQCRESIAHAILAIEPLKETA